MPFALGAGLGEVGAAVLLALFCMAVVYLIKAIAAVLPKINLYVVTLDLGAAFTTISNPVVSWLVGATNELWADAEWWMRGISYITGGLFDDVKNVLGTLFGHVDHIYNEVIPNAARTAVSDAKSAGTDAINALGKEIAKARTDFEKVASADEAKAIAKAKSLVSGVEGDITAIGAHAISTAEGYADREIAGLKAHVDQGIADAKALATAGINGLSTDLLGRLAIVGAAVAAITSEFESCGVRTCDGNNNFGNLLQDALGLAGLAEFASFLDDVIKNPAAAEQEYSGVFSGLIGAGTSAFDDLLAL